MGGGEDGGKEEGGGQGKKGGGEGREKTELDWERKKEKKQIGGQEK